MDREAWKQLAHARLEDAQVLLAEGRFGGSYYLSGYVIECALKACISKQTRQYEFPDKTRAQRSHSHDLEQLLRVSGLEPQLREREDADAAFAVSWTVVKDWAPGVRYQVAGEKKARNLMNAVIDSEEGVFPWLKQHW